MKTAIHWFRRDLRLTDNTSLNAAGEQAESVVPVYIVSDWRKSHRWTGPHRQQFLCESLESLDKNLRSAGSTLTVRIGEQVAELLKLVKETRAEAVFYNRDPDPHGRAVEAKLSDELAKENVEVIACKDIALHERDEVLTNSGTPFRVFTPYSRAWAKLAKPEAGKRPRKLNSPNNVRSEELPTLSSWGLARSGEVLPGGERAARDRMHAFLRGAVDGYDGRRDQLAAEATSRLSQDLRFGLLSIRELFAKCEEARAAAKGAARQSVSSYINELCWREFYFQILWHFPEVLEEEFNEKYRGLSWPGSDENLERWKAGETGFPVVDAGMRQLAETGFMHNRARMITAMFLTKDLHIDWREGEKWFMQQLTDGEIASNNGGWQWSAGTGADAAPYFRIQNPWTQTERFDPSGAYIKRWVPELNNVGPKKFTRPPTDGKPLAKDYPSPIVDHSEERQKTLARYKRE